MNRFLHRLFFCCAITFLTITYTTHSHAEPLTPQWPNLPLACTPERAGFWVNEADRPPCHCPPVKTFCPKNIDEWRGVFNRPAPPEVIFHCCWAAYTQKLY